MGVMKSEPFSQWGGLLADAGGFTGTADKLVKDKNFIYNKTPANEGDFNDSKPMPPLVFHFVYLMKEVVMQIDFHHAVVFVLSRLAGFSWEDASVIAHSSQYVDDEVRDEILRFDNGAIYKTICSAHKKVDYSNLENLKNHLVWVPFHFLPGNTVDSGAGDEFEERLVCRKNSDLAKDMVRECIRSRNQPNALHRLGITLHVYADTWAHQGFSGIDSRRNRVDYFRDEEDEVSKKLIRKVAGYFSGHFQEELGKLVETVLPLGHGAVLSYPDLPYLRWRYRRHDGEAVERDNSAEFLEAANWLFRALCGFREGNTAFEKLGEVPDADLETIRKCFTGFAEADGIRRHARWLEAIREGVFLFGPEEAGYAETGEGSWFREALGVDSLEKEKKYEYSPRFLDSHFRRFHDALEDHRYYLIHRLFPENGLLVA